MHKRSMRNGCFQIHQRPRQVRGQPRRTPSPINLFNTPPRSNRATCLAMWPKGHIARHVDRKCSTTSVMMSRWKDVSAPCQCKIDDAACHVKKIRTRNLRSRLGCQKKTNAKKTIAFAMLQKYEHEIVDRNWVPKNTNTKFTIEHSILT